MKFLVFAGAAASYLAAGVMGQPLLANPDSLLAPSTDPNAPSIIAGQDPAALAAPAPDAGPIPSADSLILAGDGTADSVIVGASGGKYQFDYNFLGCSNSLSPNSCSNPFNSRYSPESSSAPYYTAKGGVLTVRLWYPQAGADFSLFIEMFDQRSQTWVNYITGSPGPTRSWEKIATFRTQYGASYRFRAYRYNGPNSGAGYYTMSWLEN